MKKVAGSLRLELAQYRELAAFAQFDSDLDKATQARLSRGERIVEILKQDQYQPMAVEDQVVIIYCCINGYLDDIPVEGIKKFEEGLLKFLKTTNYKDEVLKTIRTTGKLEGETEEALNKAIKEFKDTFQA